jgi:uncharacterized membrane protein
VLGGPDFGGVLFGLVFWWQSLTPTLVPRPWPTQAVVSAVCLVVGYALGVLVGGAAARALARSNHRPGPTAVKRWWIALTSSGLIAILVGGPVWLHWQNDQRTLMGIPPLGWWQTVAAVVLSLLLGGILLVLGRLIGNGVRRLHGLIVRRVPNAKAAIPVTVLTLVIAVGIIAVAGFAGLDAVVRSAYGAENDTTEEGTSVPSSSAVSGSAESLVPWETLGRTGRNFVAEATTRGELEAFHGPDGHPVDPVRVYVGMRSAPTLQERAELAVRELERTGGFDRHVLVVWVPTGSGWMIPEAAEALEQLYDGDSAIVAIQYSYLPSLFSVFLDPGLAETAGKTLFDAVEQRWRQLPRDRRPELLLFGKSLGASGVEAPFAGADASSSLANLVARTDGALIVGAQHGNTILSQLTNARDPRSPVWQPVFDDGHTVRFVTRDASQPSLTGPWPSPRVVYLQHPSDPVPFWGVSALWRPPEWMDQPRGYDVPGAARWFPIVSAVQAVADQVHQLSPPPGFGHDYATEYVMGWADVAPPPGWTDSDTRRLEAFLDHGDEGESHE